MLLCCVRVWFRTGTRPVRPCYSCYRYWTIETDPSRSQSNATRLSLVTNVTKVMDAARTFVRLSGTFVRCDSFIDEESCPGGDRSITAKCKAGYEGTACCRCSGGFYKLFGTCYACDTTWKKVANILAVAFLVFTWLFLNNYVCEEVDSLDVFFSFAQMANVIGIS